MPEEYVLDHHQQGERQRLTLMSRLLDPMHRRHIDELGAAQPGARTLEVGFGNGSMSAWLARRVTPGGQAVAVDLDVSLADPGVTGVEFRTGDILAGPVEPGGFDLVTARAVLHHVGDAATAVANLVASARPGGAVLLIEPDFLPVGAAEPPASGRSGTAGWPGRATRASTISSAVSCLPCCLAWAWTASRPRPRPHCIPGGSPWAEYWRETVAELRRRLVASGGSTTARSTRSWPSMRTRPGGPRPSRSPPSPGTVPAAEPGRSGAFAPSQGRPAWRRLAVAEGAGPKRARECRLIPAGGAPRR